ncbi:exodeoxyribonuclease V subunit gamma [Tessaracoccus antarcticus]|uniref:exodeoxyribonuclease V subunit gamma n=1 Tax=Tessaracoccus antarcticus TaxID=2479848 RepID=UPI0013141619|nr:exodeoxyribonuclease V subunit gamma [Tessaracoccus antarcticus]
MGLEVLHSSSWDALVASLATWLSDDPPGVFETVNVVVSSRSVGRVLRQQLAQALPTAICAGVEFLTVQQWVQAAARTHGLAEDLTAWRSTRLQLAVAGALDELVTDPAHPVLAAHLGAEGSPARRMQLADRLSHLLRRYVEWAPDMVQGWLELDPDDDEQQPTDALGEPLPARLSWQPELVRRVVETLMIDPVDTWSHLASALEADTTGMRAGFFAVSEMATSHVRLVVGHGQTHDSPIWQVDGTAFDDWTAPLEVSRREVGPTGTPKPGVEVHGSHGPARQVEVLRDELCRRFEADATLEPRDVLVVCPDPQSWWPHLRTAFAPTPDDPRAHPGRSLRVQVGTGGEANRVVHLIHELLRLADDRATASLITELILLPPVAHRWRLTHRRDDVTALVAAAEVRWGLDERHRDLLGLGGVTQNTWLRGLDRLLAGLTMAPDSTALPITGVETVGASDLELVGTLSELVSRLRKFTHGSSSPATVAQWVARVRTVLDELVGPSFDDEWMVFEAHSVLTDMTEQLSTTAALLTRAEFARLFSTASRELTPRSAVGNGALQVVAVGELQHVAHRLVCLLGVSDPVAGGDPDLVALGEHVPQRRGLLAARLLAHARAAEDVLVVQQDRDAHTNAELAEATAVTSLVRDLGVDPVRVPGRPLHSHSEANFTSEPRRSFDTRGLDAAVARRQVEQGTPAAHVQRRRAAISLDAPYEPMEAGVADLHRFLTDPAKAFLQSAAAVRIFEPAHLKDELPLELGGLESWGVKDRLLRSLRGGLTPEQAATQEFQRESLPPKLIGRALLREPMKQVMGLWAAAEKDLVGDVVEHRIDLDLGALRLQDSISTRGGQVVAVVASKGIKQELLPWLQVLALAAMGVPARAAVHRMDRENWFDVPTRREIVAPPSDVALELLGVVAEAYQQGRSRLVPVPLEPALAYAGQLMGGGTPDMRQWELPSRDWDAPWKFLPPQWRLFYGDNAPAELFTDKRTHRDPASEQESAFGAWTKALYVPLLRGGL